LDLSTGEEERKDNYYLLIGKAKYFGDASPATLISSSSVEEIMTYTKKVSTKTCAASGVLSISWLVNGVEANV